MPFCQENSVGVIVYSPMHSGLLTGKMTPERVGALPDDDWRKRNPDFQPPSLAHSGSGMGAPPVRSPSLGR